MGLGQVILAIAFAIMAFAFSGLNNLFSNQEETVKINQIDSLANQMASLRGYVSAYGSSHPSKNGTASDNELGLPLWFSGRDIRIKNQFNNGKGYVFCSGNCPGGLEGRLRDVTGNSLNVGHNDNGYLNVRGVKNTNITLPTAIQNGDVVYTAIN